MSYINVGYGTMFNDILDVQIICEVAKRRSFAAAARSLGQPPATVSRRVAIMESRAGVRLFERTTRTVQLTQEGTLIVGHAQRMLEETQAIQASLESMRDSPCGKIRVSAPVILAEALLGSVVQQFLNLYPQCQTFVDISNRKVDMFEEQYDVAIRVGNPGDSGLIARKLGVVEAGLYLAAAATKNLHYLSASKPSELTNAKVMLLKSNDQSMDQLTLLGTGNEREVISVDCQFVTNNPMVLMQAGETGDSLMVIPHMIAREKVRLGSLNPVLIEWAVNRADVYAVMTSRKLMRPAVRAFLDVVISELTHKL